MGGHILSLGLWRPSLLDKFRYTGEDYEGFYLEAYRYEFCPVLRSAGRRFGTEVRSQLFRHNRDTNSLLDHKRCWLLQTGGAGCQSGLYRGLFDYGAIDAGR